MASFKKLLLFFMAFHLAASASTAKVSIAKADFCDDLKKLVDDGHVSRRTYGLMAEDQIARYEHAIARRVHPENPAGQIEPPANTNKPPASTNMPGSFVEVPSIIDFFKGSKGFNGSVGFNSSKSDPPFAGYMPSHCDWATGTKEDGEGKLACVAYCKDHFRDQDECEGSRCIAFNGPVELSGPKMGQNKPGKCFCTCGCPNIHPVN
ncbi:hypothetical protein BFW01_g2180 [Lasiodiplodia theobromae]|nr:hypothetical protein BFW01_g2180 [Lasiodiplodia theobromae]